MSFTLWLSAEEERILEGIMRHEGARNKSQAAIMAILDKGAQIDADRHVRATPASVAGGLPEQSTSLGRS
jgi:hypothetical protein